MQIVVKTVGFCLEGKIEGLVHTYTQLSITLWLFLPKAVLELSPGNDASSGLVGVLAWCSNEDDQPLLAPRLLPWKLSKKSSCLSDSSDLKGKRNLTNTI